MKKTIITAALALGLAASASATTYSSTPDNTATNKGGYGGWTMIWNGDDMTSSPALPNKVALTSIAINTPGDGSSNNNVMLAIYNIDTELQNVTVLNSLAGLSTNNSGTWSTNQAITFNFDNVELTSGNRYAFLFVESTYMKEGVATAVTEDYLSTVANFTEVNTTLRVVQGSGLTTGTRAYGSEPLNDGQFWSHQTVVATYTSQDITTPAVPEPATATLSLLALAGLAARRRRK